MRIVSQNQWNCTDNLSHWQAQGLDCSSKVRMKGHTQVIKTLLPDILGGQEVNKEMQLDLQIDLLEAGLHYTLIWGSMTPIFYRADKLELLDAEFYPYPEHLEGYDGICNDAKSKNANLAVFRDKESGKTFVFVTTHLWWKNGSDPSRRDYQAGSDQVRTWQLQAAMALVERYREKYDGCPAVILGDLNTRYHSEAIQYALHEGGYVHAHDVAVEYAHDGEGYNGCNVHYKGPGIWSSGSFEDAIDHILVKGFPADAVRRFDRYTPDDYVYLSDHAPVIADIAF